MTDDGSPGNSRHDPPRQLHLGVHQLLQLGPDLRPGSAAVSYPRLYLESWQGPSVI